MSKLFKGKCILVTGGAGSIGRTIIRHLLPWQPLQIRSFDQSESAQFELSRVNAKHKNIRYLIGDVRDAERVRRAMEGVDYVFHASALKHVPLCEYNPFEAVHTNVMGTQNVLSAAMAQNIRAVINISTDKAVNPIGAMGAAKLLAERLTTASYYSSGPRRTRCASVRFGNVMNTNGSVIPTFHQQIRQGGPVTVTDGAMTRFMMSIEQAIDLIFEALSMTHGGEIFILKMPTLRIKDLAQEMIRHYQSTNGNGQRPIKIKEIGIRAGEKLSEALMTPEEAATALELPHMFILPPREPFEETMIIKRKYPRARPASGQAYTSDQQTALVPAEIRRLLQSIVLSPAYS